MMKDSTLLRSALVASAGALFLTGCVVREVRYQPPPYQQPPPPAVAVQAPPPTAAVATPPADPGAPPPAVAPAPAPAEVVVTEAPPAPIVETVTIAPGPGFIWVGGAWAWHGRWVWEGGHWARPPHRGAHWYGPRYVYRGGQQVYIAGGWR